jgi:Peptidase A4 family
MKRSGFLAVLAFALGVASASAAEVHEKGRSWSGIILKSPDLNSPFVVTTFSYVHARWTQPAVDCTQPNARVAIWVGIDGNGTPTVEQVGTVAVCDGNRTATPQVFWEMYDGTNSPGGPPQPFTVSPGDTVDASVTYSKGEFEMALTDITSSLNLW